MRTSKRQIKHKKMTKNRHATVRVPKLKLKKGDTVVVISGKSKGKQGAILRILPLESRVVVEGVALATVHEKVSKGKVGGIVKHEMPIHISNVMLLDPKEKKGTRVGRKVVDGKVVRVAKKSGTTLK